MRVYGAAGKRLILPAGKRLVVPDMRGIVKERAKLKFAAPMRWGLDAPWTKGRKLIGPPTTVATSIKGSHLPWYGGDLEFAKLNAGRIGGLTDATRGNGYLGEGTSKNECIDSEDMTAWGTNGVTFGGPIIVAGIRLDELIADDGSADRILQTMSAQVADATEILLSVHVKQGTDADEDSGDLFRIDDGSSTNRIQAPISWASGVPSFGAISVFGGFDTTASWVDIIDPSNGLYRLSVRCKNNTGGASTVRAQLYASNIGDAGDSIYYGGVQVEYGVSVPTSYIKTTTVSETRPIDICKWVDGDNLSDIGFTLYFAFTPMSDNAANRAYAGINDGGASNRFAFFSDVDSGSRVFINPGNKNIQDVSVLTRGQTYVWAFAATTDDMRLYRDGVEMGTALTSVAMPTGLTTLDIGNDLGSSPGNANMAHIHLFEGAHEPAQVAVVSTEIAALAAS